LGASTDSTLRPPPSELCSPTFPQICLEDHSFSVPANQPRLACPLFFSSSFNTCNSCPGPLSLLSLTVQPERFFHWSMLELLIFSLFSFSRLFSVGRTPLLLFSPYHFPPFAQHRFHASPLRSRCLCALVKRTSFGVFRRLPFFFALPSPPHTPDTQLSRSSIRCLLETPLPRVFLPSFFFLGPLDVSLFFSDTPPFPESLIPPFSPSSPHRIRIIVAPTLFSPPLGRFHYFLPFSTGSKVWLVASGVLPIMPSNSSYPSSPFPFPVFTESTHCLLMSCSHPLPLRELVAMDLPVSPPGEFFLRPLERPRTVLFLFAVHFRHFFWSRLFGVLVFFRHPFPCFVQTHLTKLPFLERFFCFFCVFPIRGRLLCFQVL